MMVEDCVS